METVNYTHKRELATYRDLLSCPHIEVVPNPIISDTLNVAYLASSWVLLVAEQGKIKLLCEQCSRISIIPPKVKES